MAIVLLGASVAFWLTQKKDSYTKERQYNAAEYSQQPSGICLKVPPFVVFCPQEQNGPRADAQRSDDDLKAQQEMADWAFGVLLVSTIGSFLSLIGIILIWATFNTTRRQVQIASDVAQMEFRAYPSLEPQINLSLQYLGRDVPCQVGTALLIVNKGSSPAYSVTPEVTFYCQIGGQSLTLVGTAEGDGVRETLVKSDTAGFNFRSDDLPFTMGELEGIYNRMQDKRVLLRARVVISYFDEFVRKGYGKPRTDVYWLETVLPHLNAIMMGAKHITPRKTGEEHDYD